METIEPRAAAAAGLLMVQSWFTMAPCPRPDPSIVKIAGAVFTAWRPMGSERTPDISICRFVPVRPYTLYRTMALIWSDLTNSSGPGIPSNSTRVPATWVSTDPEANRLGPTPTAGPRPVPVTVMISPGAMGPGNKLAAFRIERTKSSEVEPLPTVSVTGRLCAGMVGSVGVTVTMPEYLLAASPAGVTVTVRVAGVLPT